MAYLIFLPSWDLCLFIFSCYVFLWAFYFDKYWRFVDSVNVLLYVLE